MENDCNFSARRQVRSWFVVGLMLLLSTMAGQAQTGAAEGDADAASTPVQGADYIVAIVNTEPITRYEVVTRMARVRADHAGNGRADAGLPSDEVLEQQVLEQLITERAQLQYAREMDLHVDEQAIDQAELAIARQNELSSVEELHQHLVADGIDPTEFREDLRNQVLLQRLRAREIEPQLQVSSREVDDFIRQQTGAAASVDKSEINLGMILLAVPEGADSAQESRQRDLATEIARRADAGEDFSALARQYSDANNHEEDGGVMGLRPVQDYPALFLDGTAGKRVGTVVGPIRSPAGFHVLKVLEYKSRHELPEVRIPETHARHILLQAESQQDIDAARERLLDYRARIESGRDSFADLAERYSQDAGSAGQGGDLGWVAMGQFVPEFDQALSNLDPGQISQPIVTRFGVHLIEVLDRREQILDADTQRELARNILREQKAQEEFENWAREVRGRAYVEYRDPPL